MRRCQKYISSEQALSHSFHFALHKILQEALSFGCTIELPGELVVLFGFFKNPDALVRLQDNNVRTLGMEGVQDPVNSNVTSGKNKDVGSHPHFAKTWEKGNQLGLGFTACGGDIQNQVLHLLSNPSLPVFFLLWLLWRCEKNSY